MRYRSSRVFVALSVAFVGLTLVAAAPAGATTRVLLVGDSWTYAMWSNQNLRDAFANHGFSSVTDKGDVTAIPGSTAAVWAQSGMLGLLTSELVANPSIDIVHLSMGGNDILAGQSSGGWYKGMGSTAEANLMNTIQSNINTVIQHILSIRPTASIVICSYDYINLWDTLNIQSNQLLYANLNSPTPRELNEALLKLGEKQRQLAVSYGSAVTYVNNWGQMHQWTGYNMVFQAGQYPAPYGHPSYPWERGCGASNGDDAIHLSDAGYDVLAENCWNRYYYYLIDPNSPSLPTNIDDDFPAPPSDNYSLFLYDGFESGYGNWLTSGATLKYFNTYWGSVSLELDNTDYAIRPQNTSGYDNIHVTFWLKTAGYDSLPQDRFYVEYTTNYGSSWNTIQTFTGNRDWTFCEYLLPASCENNPLFGIRLRAGTNSNGDDAFIDEFRLEATAM